MASAYSFVSANAIMYLTADEDKVAQTNALYRICGWDVLAKENTTKKLQKAPPSPQTDGSPQANQQTTEKDPLKIYREFGMKPWKFWKFNIAAKLFKIIIQFADTNHRRYISMKFSIDTETSTI